MSCYTNKQKVSISKTYADQSSEHCIDVIIQKRSYERDTD